VTGATLITDIDVMTANDLEEACKQSVAMGTLISMLAMVPLHIIGMYVLFLKTDQIFNPHRISADQRRNLFFKGVAKK
jgi:hypothetical protein